MAPVAQTPDVNESDDSSNARFNSWLEKHGEAEYDIYKSEDAISALSYDQWVKSTHVLGPYLLHVTMDIWNEPSSNEDEASEVEAVDVISRNQRTSTRPKNVATNGYGMRQSIKSSGSTSRPNSDEASGPTKRKKKSKKHSLSHEIVKSDESDAQEEVLANERRKSGGRKKKHFLSEAIIAPEDMDDDATSVDATAMNIADAIQPTEPEHRTPVAFTSANTPKAKSVKKPKKKSLPQKSSQPDDEDGPATKKLVAPNASAASPGALSASRRGLRARTAAQQNPYQHNAKLFEDQLDDEKSGGSNVEISPKKQTIKFKRTSRPIEEVTEETPMVNVDDDDDDDAEPGLSDDLLPNMGRAYYKGKGRAWRKTEEDEDEEFITKTKVDPPNPAKRAGRRKSTQSAVYAPDDSADREAPMATPAIAQNAPASISSPSSKPPRKKPGPKPGFKKAQAAARKLQMDQNGAEPATQVKQEMTPKIKREKTKEPLVTTPSSLKKLGKQKSGPRRSQPKSEEYILDSSDTDVADQQAVVGNRQKSVELPAVEPTHQPPRSTGKPRGRPRGRPRRSDQSTLSKATVDSDDDAMSIEMNEAVPAPTVATSIGTGSAEPAAAISEQPLIGTEDSNEVEKKLPDSVQNEIEGPVLQSQMTE
ncbi:unnamed protein product [Periconia digitata]|uniref:Uncharacterized protein n=1 Tax=Periconia digitata TaxID=1303443 RepID=A0A9W4UPM2_9PLEO|nr:unnamed protein product [Periconia digitata]